MNDTVATPDPRLTEKVRNFSRPKTVRQAKSSLAWLITTANIYQVTQKLQRPLTNCTGKNRSSFGVTIVRDHSLN